MFASGFTFTLFTYFIMKNCCRFLFQCAVFAETSKRIFSIPPKKPVFGEGNAKWIDELGQSTEKSAKG